MRIGKETKANGFLFANLAEPESEIFIGSGCLFASVKLRPSDSHQIIDLSTNERINPPEPIKIGDHVWIADDCVVLGGAEIGSGSIVGIRSMVNARLPENCLAVGIPARPIKENVTWAE